MRANGACCSSCCGSHSSSCSLPPGWAGWGAATRTPWPPPAPTPPSSSWRGSSPRKARPRPTRSSRPCDRAFKDSKTVGVVLRINSPGGSPVQSGYIYDEMRRLRAKYPNIPLYVVVEDLCASGGYYVAVGADRIYVDKASMVGSIGVIMDGFGFTGAHGEARHRTAAPIPPGDNKEFLDPFAPVEREAARARAENARRHPPAVHQRRCGRAAASA